MKGVGLLYREIEGCFCFKSYKEDVYCRRSKCNRENLICLPLKNSTNLRMKERIL
eukprot:GAHX01003429.1.p2 GENE.GAHX01003429.1~~GAHX01003429.1.p2  ORF type:complete len:55 (-),score=8.83 GAHX01003429.1:49-213(-)